MVLTTLFIFPLHLLLPFRCLPSYQDEGTKTMKKIALFLFIPIFAVIIAVLALILFVNPNQFKPVIVEQVQKQTGLELVISGDIHWNLFPSIGFSLGKIELRNPSGFDEKNLVQFDKAELDVSVRPLLNNTLEIGQITLDGARVYIQTLADGTSNLDSLTKAAAKSEPTPAEKDQVANPEDASPSVETEQKTAAQWQITLAGIEVINASAVIKDATTASYTELSQLNFHLDKFAPGEWSQISFDLAGKTAEQNFTAKGETALNIAKTLDNVIVKNLALAATYADKSNTIKTANISLDQFELGEWANINFDVTGNNAEMSFDAKGATQLRVEKNLNLAEVKGLTLASNLVGDVLPKGKMAIKAAADANYNMPASTATLESLKLELDSIVLDGNASAELLEIPKIRFKFHSPNIDLDEFLGLANTPKVAGSVPSSEEEGSQTSPKPQPSEQEPDLSALKTLDLAGTFTIDKFKASNARLSSVVTDLSVNRGVIKLKKFSSKLYEGSILATATIDARKSVATYSVKKNIKGVQVQPLLEDVMGDGIVAGQGNIDVNVSGKGLAQTTLKKNLKGQVNINFADGAVYGINLPQLIRENYAKFTGKKSEETAQEQKTDFSALTATLNLAGGVMKTNNLSVASPLLRIHGEGQANYIKEDADFLIRTSIVGSLKGQGGKDIDDLKDVTIPVRVSGLWAKPKFKLEFDDVLKAKAKKEAERGLNKLLGDKLDDSQKGEIADKLLKGLFN